MGGCESRAKEPYSPDPQADVEKEIPDDEDDDEPEKSSSKHVQRERIKSEPRSIDLPSESPTVEPRVKIQGPAREKDEVAPPPKPPLLEQESIRVMEDFIPGFSVYSFNENAQQDPSAAHRLFRVILLAQLNLPWIIQTIISLGGSIYAVRTGSVYLHLDCSKPIAVWLIAIGCATILFDSMWVICRAIIDGRYRSGINTFIYKFMWLTLFFLFIWVICGQVWVFTSSKENCAKGLYLTGWWYLVGVYIFCGTMLIWHCGEKWHSFGFKWLEKLQAT